jgi:maleate isomerase
MSAFRGAGTVATCRDAQRRFYAARIDTASLRAAVERLGKAPDVEAVFVSRTSLRIAGLVPELEARIGKPVISSNFAMAWHALRLAGVEGPEPERGRLFAL